MKKLLLMMTLIGALLSGCTALEKVSETADKVSTMSKTAQTKLDLNSIKGIEYTLEGSDITVVFDSGRIYGFSGVNRYFGVIKIEGDKVTIDNIASTMMAGESTKMKSEAEYLKKLSNINKIVIEENSISLLGNEKPLKFIKK